MRHLAGVAKFFIQFTDFSLHEEEVALNALFSLSLTLKNNVKLYKNYTLILDAV